MISRTLRTPVALLLALIGPAVAHAEYYGLVTGRLVGASRMPDKSIEAGVVLGDLYDADYQHFGARFNIRLSPEVMGFVDFGQTEIEDDDGTALGAGLFYVVDGIFTNQDFAIKGSYHRIEAEAQNGDEGTLTNIAVEGVVSGREGLGADGNIGWYANVGVHKLDFDDFGTDETELGFGGGIVVPNAGATGEFYLGLDIVDEMTYGAGYRYFLK